MIAAAWLALVGPAVAEAAPGDLDMHFGREGLAAPFLAEGSGVRALLAQDNGVFAAATNSSDGAPDAGVLVARYTRAGRRDSAFGVRRGPGTYRTEVPVGIASGPGGSATVAIAGSNEVSSVSAPILILTRFRPDGSTDPAFGDGGRVDYPQITPVELIGDSAGRLLVIGYRFDTERNAEPVLRRFLEDGATDASFGDGGVVMLPSTARPTALAAAPDGSVAVASTGDPTVARYDAAGQPDPRFAWIRRFAETPATPQVALDERERAVLLTTSGDGGALLSRYLRDGQPDPTFGTDGSASAAGIYPTDLALEDGHSILVAGFASAGAPQSKIARFTAGGQLDKTFAESGFLRPIVGAKSFVPPLVEPDGRGGLLIGGIAPKNDQYAPDEGTFARYEGGGPIVVTVARGGSFSRRQRSVRLSARNHGPASVRAEFTIVEREGSRLIRVSQTSTRRLDPGHNKAVTLGLSARAARQFSRRPRRRALVRVRSEDRFGHPKEALQRVTILRRL